MESPYFGPNFTKLVSDALSLSLSISRSRKPKVGGACASNVLSFPFRTLDRLWSVYLLLESVSVVFMSPSAICHYDSFCQEKGVRVCGCRTQTA